MVHPIAALGNLIRTARTRGLPVAECRSGHDLTEEDVARGVCPHPDCPTLELFPGKGLVEGGER